MSKLLLVDGDNLLHRCWHANSAIDGEVSAVIDNFCNAVINAAGMNDCTHQVVIFDTDLPSFRHNLFHDYKAHRAPKAFDVNQYRCEIKSALMQNHCRVLDLAGYEADDVIATMAIRASDKAIDCLIMTTDSDYWALIRDGSVGIGSVHILRPPVRSSDGFKVIDVMACVSKYALIPSQLVELKMLVGDRSDNIPGVNKVGAKTGLKLLQKYGDIANILANLDVIGGVIAKNIGDADLELMRTLVTLKVDVPLPTLHLENYKI